MRKSKRIELNPETIKYWTGEAKKQNNKFKPFIEHLLESRAVMKKEKLIVWFLPTNKKIQLNQFHVLASSIPDAIKQLNANKDFDVKLMGVSVWRESMDNSYQFTNLKFY